MNKKALITGIAGQDGYFLSKFLLEKGYKVFGITRKKDYGSLSKLTADELRNIHIYNADINNERFIKKIIAKEQFDEIYHLAAQSHVKTSFEKPKETFRTNVRGTLSLIEAIKDFSPKTKLYFAATSELFGKSEEEFQDEKSPLQPQSPYGISKLAGYYLIQNYRDSYGLFLVNGILFNHESEIRPEKFVTRKITKSVANISLGKQDYFEIGNMNAKRDWGHAKDFVEAMWLMLQQETPEDFVIATGESHSVREFIEAAFAAIDISITWEGEGVDEIGKDSVTGKMLVRVNKEFFRPVDIAAVLGNPKKAKEKLGWEPKTKFSELVKTMVEHDIASTPRKKIALFVDSVQTHYGWGTVGYQLYHELQKRYDVLLVDASTYSLDQYKQARTRWIRTIFAAVDVWRKIPKDCHIAINTAENLYPLVFWSTRGKNMRIAGIGYGTYSYFPFVFGKYKRLYSWYLSAIDQLYLSSNYSIRRVKEFYKKHIILLPLGVDTKKYHPTNQEQQKEIALTFVGGQKERKGIYQLLEAVKIVKKQVPEITIYLVGKIDQEFKSHVESQQLEKTFVFCGEVSHEELLAYYSKSIGNILPSVNTEDSFEGFGLIHLEANACGIPSIGSKDTANDDVIIDRETGYLARQNDSQDIAEKILELIKHKEYFAEKKEALIAHAKKCNWEHTVNILEDTFIKND